MHHRPVLGSETGENGFMRNRIRLFALTILILLSSSIIAIASTTNSISFGAITNGSITGPAQTNFYSFSASSNDVIFLIVKNTNGPALPYLYLYDSRGTNVAAGYN